VFLRGRDADARLRGLERQRARVRPVLGALAAAFAERKAHEALGFRSLGDWSREQLGVGARAVAEWGRLPRRLESLPRLRRAVLEGEIGWAVARRVAPLATPETEAACLETVRGRTVRAVEAIVAAVRAAEGATEEGAEEEGGERVEVRIPCPPHLLDKWLAGLELARRVAGEALPVWACAEAIAAEAASALGGPEDPPEALAPPAGGGDERGSPAAVREHGLRHVAWPQLSWSPQRPWLDAADDRAVERLSEGLGGCSALELDNRMRAAVVFLQALDLEAGRLLRQVLERRLHLELGFESFERYVAERLDLSARTARRLVALARGERRAPEVTDAFRAGRLTAFQAHALLRTPGALPPPDPAGWVAHARRVTLRRLEDDVPEASGPAIAFLAPPDVAALFVGMLERVRREADLASSAQALEAILDHAIAAFRALAQPGYEDFDRDRWRCTVPGCTSRRNLHSHHVRFRSAGGPDASWNRTTLCAAHHQRGVHGGRIRLSIAGRAPDELVFMLGVGRYRSGDVAM
jgi:hypothetical protein